MDLIARVAKHFEDSAHTKLNAVDAMSAPIAAAIETMFNCLINGGKILACGNGGSAGDAQHFAAELIGRFEAERQELAADMGPAPRNPQQAGQLRDCDMDGDTGQECRYQFPARCDGLR